MRASSWVTDPRLCRRAAAVAVVGAWCATPAHAADLADVTTVTAERPAFASITLREPLKVSDHGSGSEPPELRFALESPGDFVTVVLRAVQPGAFGRHPMLTSTTRHGRGVITHGDGNDLPAGLYRVYVVFDRGPAKVRIEAPALRGSSSVVAATPMPWEGGALPLIGTEDGVTRYGEIKPISGETLVMWDLAYDFPPGTAGRQEQCVYESESRADAFSPGCPGGSSLAPQGQISAGGYGDGARSFFEVPAAGIGANFTSPGGGPEVYFRATWLPVGRWDQLEEPRPAGAVQPPEGSAGVAPTVARRGLIRGGRALVRVRCPRHARETCAGRLDAGGKGARFALRPGASRTLRIALRRDQRAARVLRLTLTLPDQSRRRVRVLMRRRAD